MHTVDTKGRRQLVAAISVALTMPRAFAQPTARPPRIAMIVPGTAARTKRFLDALVGGLRALGYVHGSTMDLKVRYADGDTTLVPSLLRDAVAERPDIILVIGAAAARHAKEATTAIPVVVTTASDLVEAGVVSSLARPGGNITGLSDMVDESTAKRVELAREVLPKASRIALLIDPSFPAAKQMEQRSRAVASANGFQLVPLYALNRDELTEALRSLSKERVDALVIGGSALHTNFVTMIIEQATASKVPVMHYWPGTAEAGALASHGPNVEDNFRRAATYVDRILKGAKPADLPIEQPTRFELILNLKAAKALKITIPKSVMLRADRVIE